MKPVKISEKKYIQLVLRKQHLEKHSPVVKEYNRTLKIIEQYDKQLMTTQMTFATSEPVLNPTEKIIKERIEKIQHLLLVKGKEYVRGNDRLHNFRRTAESQRISMPEALHGFLMKHITSYFDIIDDIKNGKEISDNVIDEKIGDIMVYMLLQEATIKQHFIEYSSKARTFTFVAEELPKL